MYVQDSSLEGEGKEKQHIRSTADAIIKDTAGMHLFILTSHITSRLAFQERIRTKDRKYLLHQFVTHRNSLTCQKR